MRIEIFDPIEDQAQLAQKVAATCGLRDVCIAFIEDEEEEVKNAERRLLSQLAQSSMGSKISDAHQAMSPSVLPAYRRTGRLRLFGNLGLANRLCWPTALDNYLFLSCCIKLRRNYEYFEPLPYEPGD